MKTFRPKNYLSHLPPYELKLQETVFLKNELTRVSNNMQLPPLDVDRYKVLEPSDSDDLEEWSKCINNAKSQLAHMENRNIDLQLLSKYGETAWREHIKETEVLVAS